MPKQKSFPNYKMKSGWNALLPARESSPALDRDISVDVLVIGAGWTGISAAKRWHSLSPEAGIALIDASEIGEGNPGRNSGFLLSIALAEDANPDQIEKMSLCNRLTASTMAEILAEIEDSGHAVDIAKAGTYRAAASEAGLKSLQNYRAFLEAAGLEYESLERSALRSRMGSDFYQEGLYSPDCYLAQPAAAIRALASLLPESVQLFENTPALKLKQQADGWQVQTPNGVINAHKLVLANNAFSKELGIARSRLVAMHTYAGLTPVLEQSVLDDLGSDENWGLLPTHRLGSTLRRTIDGRLMVRSMHSYEQEAPKGKIEGELQHRLEKRFPQLPNFDFEHCWGGAVGFTFNGGAVWGKFKPGLYVSAGCNGGGTVKGTLLGKLLAEAAHDLKVPDVPELFGRASWMPPEPIRRLGYNISAALESHKGRREL
ncbi:MAG: FAD-dependent oxidoreductase [SAR86 cluster bacterium]|uniref:FAD-dependent oxidoreductase n=1 Tax=SAR86 cluster bacterium TaxID=2030880 RepID=A0A2A4X5N6_9GAMM|nr:MAG: FAD-dependent oxidoreductase [SAR86 cluster bacterium]